MYLWFKKKHLLFSFLQLQEYILGVFIIICYWQQYEMQKKKKCRPKQTRNRIFGPVLSITFNARQKK